MFIAYVASFFYLLLLRSLAHGWLFPQPSSFVGAVEFCAGLLAVWLTAVVHECSHLGAGIAFGYSLQRFAIPHLELTRTPGGCEFKLWRTGRMLGFCEMIRPTLNSRWREFLYLAGGCIGNLAQCGVAAWALHSIPFEDGSFVFVLTVDAFFLGLVSLVSNLIPSVSDSVANDGANLRRLLRQSDWELERAIRECWSMLKRPAPPPKDWPCSLVLTIEKVPDWHESAVGALSLLCLYYEDREDEHQLTQAAARLRAEFEYLSDQTRTAIMPVTGLDLVWYAGRYLKDKETATDLHENLLAAGIDCGWHGMIAKAVIADLNGDPECACEALEMALAHPQAGIQTSNRQAEVRALRRFLVDLQAQMQTSAFGILHENPR